MKRLAAALLIGLAIPAYAQHSAAHASAAPHAAPSFHSGSPASASHGFGSGGFGSDGFSNAPRMNWNAPHSAVPRPRPHYALGPTFGAGGRNSGPGLHRPPYDPQHQAAEHHEHDRDRRGSGFRPFFFASSTYLVPGYPGYDNPGYGFGYDDSGDGSYAQPADQDQAANDGYGNEIPFQNDDQSPRGAYPPSYQQQPGPASQSASAPDPPPITLVFNDGRAPEQIHNYALTRTTLYVLDAHHRDIPLTQLDIVATQKANQDSGIDFRLPVTVN
jgi:hypothetical protein